MWYLGVILFFVVLGVNLYVDYKTWKKGIAINHKRGAILRVLGLAPIPFLIGWSVLGLVLSLYWFLFDGLFNIIRGFGWWFTGSEDGKDDAKTDNFLQRLKLWQHVTIKLGFILLSALLFILVK